MLDNTAHIIAIELLAAAQGIDFLRPLQSSAPVEVLHTRLRADCASMPADHYLAPDIERATALVHAGALRAPGAPRLEG
jgi:histidine ammonia-lyase